MYTVQHSTQYKGSAIECILIPLLRIQDLTTGQEFTGVLCCYLFTPVLVQYQFPLLNQSDGFNLLFELHFHKTHALSNYPQVCFPQWE